MKTNGFWTLLSRLILQPIVKPLCRNLFKRELVLLPITQRRGSLLSMTYNYRADSGRLKYHLLDGPGMIKYTLQSWPDQAEPSCQLYFMTHMQFGARFEVDILESQAWMNGRPLKQSGRVPVDSHKFVATIEFQGTSGSKLRKCSHYIPRQENSSDSGYYFGKNYVNYAEQVETRAIEAVEHVRMYCKTGRLLDVGCGLGIHVEGFLAAGFDACGVDVSPFAVNEACKRNGKDRALQCDLDVDEIPFDTTFDIFWISQALEHFKNPEQNLSKLGRIASSGAYLFLETPQSQSLSHLAFGKDWEGYVDYTHHGIDKISVANLRKWLGREGWKILKLDCNLFWTNSVDPVSDRLKLLSRCIPEMQQFLNERCLGDFVMIVARKEKST